MNYHSTSTDFTADMPDMPDGPFDGPFIRSYHIPEVRALVQEQLQGMADAGADENGPPLTSGACDCCSVFRAPT